MSFTDNRMGPILLGVSLLFLSACGGGGGGGTPVNHVAPAAATPTLSFVPGKIFRFSWSDSTGATFYRLLENPDGASGFTQVGGDIAQGQQTFDLVQSVPLYERLNAQYQLQSCNSIGCTDSSTITVNNSLAGAVSYLKASNTDSGDWFGVAVALSDDGNTLAVGAYREDSAGASAGEADNSAQDSGAVYVFARSGNVWSQQAWLKAGNAEADDFFGVSVSLSANGDTLVVGASGEDSNATGINGNPADNTVSDSGAAYVFTRSSGAWTQQAYVKASNPGGTDWFGHAVALNDAGDTLAVAAFAEDSDGIGVGGNQTSKTVISSGAVYVFTLNGGSWSQQEYLKASNAGAGDEFGRALTLSADGNTLAVGASGEDSAGNNEADNTTESAGAAYVFVRDTSGVWTQQAWFKASTAEATDIFGFALALSGDGDTLAVGAMREDSNAIDISGDQSDNSVADSGAAYVYTRSGGSWSQQAYIKAGNTGAGDGFGITLALSSNGDTLVVGANGENSMAAGLAGDQSDNAFDNAGAAYMFTRTAGVWSPSVYIKASNPNAGYLFGTALGLSADGDTLAVGAHGEASGVDGDQSDTSTPGSGAVYLY